MRHSMTSFSSSDQNNDGTALGLIFEALHSSHSGQGRPPYAIEGMLWTEQVIENGEVIALDLLLDDGEKGIPFGRFDYATEKFTLQEANGQSLGSAAFQNVGTDPGNAIVVQPDSKLPALDASDLLNVPAPTNIPIPNNKRVKSLKSDKGTESSHRSCGVIMADNTLRFWGNSSYSQSGGGSTSLTVRRSPSLVPGILENSPPKKWISNEYNHLVLLENGCLYAWGRNNFGCLGVGDTNVVRLPTKVEGALLGVNVKDIKISSGDTGTTSHTLVLADDGRIFSCGYNYFGQVGDGTTVNAPLFVDITPTGVTFEKIYAFGGSYGWSMAIDSLGDLYCWGYNATGQLGLGDTTQRTIPQKNNFFGGVSVEDVSGSLANGTSTSGANFFGFTIAKLVDGSIYSFGNNGKGQLGAGNTTQYDTPQHITTLGTDNKFILTSGGEDGSSYVVKDDNRIFSTGYNSSGELGQGGVIATNTFAEMIDADSGVVEQILAVGGSSYKSFFVRYEDGSVKGCGYNASSQLGLGDATNRNVLERLPINTSQFEIVDMCTVGRSNQSGVILLTSKGECLITGYAADSMNTDPNAQVNAIPKVVTF